MSKILVVCPTKRDLRELSAKHIRGEHTIFYQNYDATLLERIICDGIGWLTENFDPPGVINSMLEIVNIKSIDAILSSEDYPGTIFASIIAKKAGLIGPDPEALLRCQHKYYSRCVQAECVPEATPDFTLIDPHNFNINECTLKFPVFIKPVKSFFSVFANRTDCVKDLSKCIERSILPEGFLFQFDWFLKNYTSCPLDSRYLLAERLLEGVQTNFDGYVYQGEVHQVGVIDSIMFPNTIVFERFNYPSTLPQSVHERMFNIAKKCITSLGIDNTLFNVEFMYNPKTDALYIIEINPRLVSQYADIFEKVDGTNSYEIALAIATGKKPRVKKKEGKYNVAACFALRLFEDKQIIKMPSQHELDHLYTVFPDSRIQLYGTEGKKLSQEFQDGKSYRYGYIHLGGRDHQELQEKYEYCKENLGIVLEPIS